MKKNRKPPPPPPPSQGGKGTAAARQMGLLLDFSSENMMASDEEDNQELKAEFLAIVGGQPDPKQKPNGKTPLPMEAIERMAALCMKDLDEENGVEEEDLEDDELMAELMEVLEEDDKAPDTVVLTATKEHDAPAPSSASESILLERLAMYKVAVANAKQAGESPKCVAMKEASKGAKSKEYIEPDEDQNSLECLKATCRGIETSLAECGLRKMSLTVGKLAKVTCYTEHRDCDSREFRCVNGKCIWPSKTCNGLNDCGDLSDELCCKACKRKCFHCNSDVCIPSNQVCNNELDCLTGEDELNCNKNERTKEEEPHQAIESMDKERKRIKTLFPALSCGIRNHTITRRKRIIGGFTAQLHEFPWQVAIKGEGQTMNCGGAYIGGCWVLTAAHCVRRSRLHVYRIWTGMVDSIKFNSKIETYSLKDMIIHENYNAKTYENDIALLEMRSKNEGKPCSPPNTVPACIPWSQYMFGGGQQCKVSGWGINEESTRQYILKWGYIYLMDNCSEIYKNRYFKGMECAGTDDGSVDSCKGDSGGPLVCFDPNNVAYLWGIVSWGENCGEKGHPGVYTKVALYFDWIARHTGIGLISKYNL